MSITVRPMVPGFSYEGTAPWGNYHEVGAAPIVRLLAGRSDIWNSTGAIPALAVPDALRRVMKALNTGDFPTLPCVVGERFTLGEVSEKSTKRRLTEVMHILRWAKAHGVGVQWG